MRSSSNHNASAPSRQHAPPRRRPRSRTGMEPSGLLHSTKSRVIRCLESKALPPAANQFLLHWRLVATRGSARFLYKTRALALHLLFSSSFQIFSPAALTFSTHCSCWLRALQARPLGSCSSAFVLRQRQRLQAALLLACRWQKHRCVSNTPPSFFLHQVLLQYLGLTSPTY